MAINVSIYSNLAYDPVKDLVPVVALFSHIPFVLVVNPALPVTRPRTSWRLPKRLRDGTCL
jgi:hypothetical protein